MLQIAIDGPSGSGKSTLARRIAKDLGLTYIDTGAMYRAVTLFLIEHHINLNIESDISKALTSVHLRFGENGCLILNGQDVSQAIRTPLIDQNVSLVSSYKVVRIAMVALQQQIADQVDAILDGRDIGTVVLPQANLKFYITASPEARAERRMREYDDKGLNVSYLEILAAIEKRDHFDSNRKESPLTVAKDAVVIDTTHMSLEQTIAQIKERIEAYRNGANFY